MDKIYYTVYKVTNKINGKVYIGTHKTRNLDDGYMGSGKYLKCAIEKDGVENFEKEILHIFDTSEEMFAKESELVDERFLTEENTYNLKVGGFGGFDYVNSSVSLEKKQYARRKANEVLEEKYGPDWNLIFNRKLRSYMDGLSKEERSKIAKKSLETRIERGTISRKKHTEETKKKIALKNKNLTGNRNSQYGTIWITDGNVSKKQRKSELIPDGWKPGRII